MNKLFLLLLLTSSVVAQEFVCSKTFESKVSEGVTVVEFWVEWNKDNQVDFLHELEDCRVYRVDLSARGKLQSKHNVTATPTLVIFNNGVEYSRFNPGIMMESSATRKEIQSIIDNILLSGANSE